jgi:nucleoid-associated protein YgaU
LGGNICKVVPNEREKIMAEDEKGPVSRRPVPKSDLDDKDADRLARQESARRAAAERAAQRAAAAPKMMAEYTVAPNDTLGSVALKYSGNAARDYWMLIYEANKDVIGDNPNLVRAGTVLQIPELPEDFKK